MAQPKPWYRKFNNTWYVQVGKRQIPLVKGKAQRQEAFQRFIELMAQQDAAALHDRTQLNVASLCDVFLDWSQRHNDRATYDWYLRYLQAFCDLHGLLKVEDLKPFHVTRWLDGRDWSASTRRGARTSLKRVLNWAVEEGYIEYNPLRGLKRPASGRRTSMITDEQHQAMLAHSDKPFQQFLTALRETGARPGEVARVTAAQVDLQQRLWILQEHKTAAKTGRPRLILMTDGLIKLTQELIDRHPTGPLFRNRFRQPWTSNAIRCRMRRLRKELDLPAHIVAYSYRHTYATNGLVNGVPIATMAELLGHADTKMISAHYAHLGHRLDYLHQAARQAVRSAGDA